MSGAEPDPFSNWPSPDGYVWTPRRFLRRHAQRTARRRRLRRAVALAALALFAWGFVFADGGLVSILQRGWQIRGLEADVARLQERRARLVTEIERREGDPQTIERLAREQYGMVRPGERVVRIREVDELQARRVELRQRARAETTAAAPMSPEPAAQPH